MTKKPKATKRPVLRGKARLRSEIVEAARDLGAAGLMDRKDVEKITVRMLGPDALPDAAALSAKEITSIREEAGMSQAVFSRLLAVSTGTVSKWERGELSPRGPARRLLLIIKAKGVEAVI